MVLKRGRFSAAPEWVRVREMEAERALGFMDAEGARSTFFIAGRNGLAWPFLEAPELVCLLVRGCGVCVRGGRRSGG